MTMPKEELDTAEPPPQTIFGKLLSMTLDDDGLGPSSQTAASSAYALPVDTTAEASQTAAEGDMSGQGVLRTFPGIAIESLVEDAVYRLT